MQVKKAVIPAAGMGTRFLPLTKSMPKEMLPIIDRPVIHYVVEEAIHSGITDILIITGRGKRAIEDYFDASPELETYLKNHNKSELLSALEQISDAGCIHYIRQKEPRGLGDALLHAQKHCDGEPFAVLLGDDIMKDHIPCTRQLMQTFEKKQSPVIAVQNVALEDTLNYGIVRGRKIEQNLYQIDNIVEKPHPVNAPSTLASIGRYVFIPEIFDYLRSTAPGVNKEIQLTDGIKSMLEKHPSYAYLFTGKRYDTGNKLKYIQTIIEFALADDKMKEPLSRYLKDVIKE